MSLPQFTANANFAAHDAAKLWSALDTVPQAGPDLLVALDIDGTTVRHDTSLSPRVKEAVLAHIDAGTHVFLATGRGIAGCHVVAEQLELPNGITVCSNGAVIARRDPGAREEGLPENVSLISYQTFDPSHEVATIAEALPDVLLAVEPIFGPRRINRQFPDGELEGESVIVPVSELATPEATRLTVRAPEWSAHELLDRIEALGLHGVQYAVGWTAWLDFSPPGITKASSLEKIRDEHGISPSACVAVGDGANDIQMLQWAQAGIAMGDAGENVVAAANARTASVNDAGLALVLEYLLK